MEADKKKQEKKVGRIKARALRKEALLTNQNFDQYCESFPLKEQLKKPRIRVGKIVESKHYFERLK